MDIVMVTPAVWTAAPSVSPFLLHVMVGAVIGLCAVAAFNLGRNL